MGKFYLMQSGTKIYIDDISENDIYIQDIAHHLTKICRYGGSLPLGCHYSVASHSIALYNYAVDSRMPVEVQKAVLAHDFSEAYLGDINGILKQHLPDYLKLEEKVTNIIESKYKISKDPEVRKIVNTLDKRILLDEVKALLPHRYREFKSQLGDIDPLGVQITPDVRLHAVRDTLLQNWEEVCFKEMVIDFGHEHE